MLVGSVTNTEDFFEVIQDRRQSPLYSQNQVHSVRRRFPGDTFGILMVMEVLE